MDFVGRFLQHVLPSGFKRIRHYGLLAPAAKAERLATSRTLLAMPAPNPRAVEDARAFMQRVAAIDIERCPHCQAGRWRCVQSLPADRAALAAIAAGCRGPP
ncbi:MAG: transposase [Burkholderiaceae bacterium]|nr:transposase [Burkholderiaceae bacterium]